MIIHFTVCYFLESYQCMSLCQEKNDNEMNDVVHSRDKSRIHKIIEELIEDGLRWQGMKGVSIHSLSPHNSERCSLHQTKNRLDR